MGLYLCPSDSIGKCYLLSPNTLISHIHTEHAFIKAEIIPLDRLAKNQHQKIINLFFVRRDCNTLASKEKTTWFIYTRGEHKDAVLNNVANLIMPCLYPSDAPISKRRVFLQASSGQLFRYDELIDNEKGLWNCLESVLVEVDERDPRIINSASWVGDDCVAEDETDEGTEAEFDLSDEEEMQTPSFAAMSNSSKDKFDTARQPTQTGSRPSKRKEKSIVIRS